MHRLAIMVLCALLSGCGSLYYTVNINSAEARVEQARQMGAETQAPFEYYYAKEHLRQAQVEAADASYSDAATYAEIAERYAQNAIELITRARKGETK
jgi:hypothetical protein